MVLQTSYSMLWNDTKNHISLFTSYLRSEEHNASIGHLNDAIVWWYQIWPTYTPYKHNSSWFLQECIISLFVSYGKMDSFCFSLYCYSEGCWNNVIPGPVQIPFAIEVRKYPKLTPLKMISPNYSRDASKHFTWPMKGLWAPSFPLSWLDLGVWTKMLLQSTPKMPLAVEVKYAQTRHHLVRTTLDSFKGASDFYSYTMEGWVAPSFLSTCLPEGVEHDTTSSSQLMPLTIKVNTFSNDIVYR